MKNDGFWFLNLCTFHKTGYFTDYSLSAKFVFVILGYIQALPCSRIRSTRKALQL